MPSARASRPRLRPLHVMRHALRVCLRHWRGLLGGALVLFTPLAVADAVLEHIQTDAAPALAGIALAETTLHVLGDVFYAGLAAGAVMAWRAGEPRMRPGVLLRTMPWGTIAALDVILSLGTAAGLLLLVVPGVVFGTYCGLAPAIAKIEHLGVWASLARSARLVHGSFWRVLFLLASIFAVGAVIEEGIQIPLHAFLGDVVANVLVQSIAAPYAAVATVVTAFALRGG